MVLVVDDSAPIRALMRTVLESAGYQVREAHDSASALSALDGVRLALVDVQLGGESGFDLAGRMRDIPVILVSGHDLPVAGYLRKPFSPSDLLQAVEQRIGG